MPGKRSKRILLPLILSAGLIAGCAQGTGSVPQRDLAPLEEALRQKLDLLREESGFPGATLAVVLPGGRTLDLVTGVGTPDGEAPMPRDARMFSGSAGKTFVAALALRLAGEGKLDLDARVAEYLGGEEWYARLPNHDAITVRMLMNHTGGLPRYVFEEAFWAELHGAPDRVWKPEEQIAYILDDDPVHPAGEGWHYSDTDYLLVGLILERITGKTYYEEVQRRILGPLELLDTTPAVGRDLPGLVPGRTGEMPELHLHETVVVDGRYIFDPQWEWTGGGLVTTASDLARWAKRLYGGDVLDGKWRDEMLRPVSTETGKPSGTGYGLGVFVRETAHGTGQGHGGIFPGYQSFMEYYPDLDCSLAFQINADRFSGKLDRSLEKYADVLLPAIAEFLGGGSG